MDSVYPFNRIPVRLRCPFSEMGTWNDSYENLNRLTGATSSAGYYTAAAMSWNHDAFGNRLAENEGGTPQVTMPTSTSASYNTSNQSATAVGVSSGTWKPQGAPGTDSVDHQSPDYGDQPRPSENLAVIAGWV